MPKCIYTARSVKATALFAAAFLILMMGSCKKESTKHSDLGLSAKIAGTATNFNNNVTGTTGTDSRGFFTTLQGTSDDGSRLAITIYGEVRAGVSYFASSTLGASALIVYTTKDGHSYSLAEAEEATTLDVTVTGVNGNRINGTFVSRVRESGSNDGTPLLILDGVFIGEVN